MLGLSVQLRISVSPASPTVVLLLVIQNLYWSVPLTQAEVVPVASSSVSWPGAPVAGGTAARDAPTEVQAGPAQEAVRPALAAVSAVTVAAVCRVFDTWTSSMYQPSSASMGFQFSASSMVTASETSMEVTRKRNRMRRPR